MDVKRIAILYRTTEGPWGGGNSFLRTLRKTWITQGIEVTDKLESELNGVLVNSSYLGAANYCRLITPTLAKRLVKTGYFNLLSSLLGLSRWRKSGRRPPFVHRLDGVFRLYGRPANDPGDIAQLGINRYMDWTIFQSEFCRKSFANEGLDVSRSTVIFNGVATNCFYPALQPPVLSPFKLVMMSWSPNVNKGAQFALEVSQLPDIKVTFIGQWPEAIPVGNIDMIPVQRHEKLPHLLRQHHILLHMAKNDPCSNVILEGMACGLPVIYHPSGGSPEIIGECGISGILDIKSAINEARNRYNQLRECVLVRHKSLSIEFTASAYLKVFEQLN